MACSCRNLVELVIRLFIGVTGSFVNFCQSGFLMNFPIPYVVSTTVDIRSEGSSQLLSNPLANNLVLLLGFGLQHSFIIRGPIHRLLRLFLSKDSTRVIFVASTSIYLLFFYSFWAPMPQVLWEVQQQELRVVLYVLNFTSWFLKAASIVTLDPWALMGIRPALDKIFNRKKEVHLTTTGLYGLMRHPIYTFLLLAYWITPTMTIGHLLFNVVMMAYILIAVAYYEEPDLVRDIGPKYAEYMKTTPRYIPNLTQCFTAAKTAKDK